jgi:hypothetical protein
MKSRISIAVALVALFAVTLPGRAADPDMLKLVMPDAKVIAGVNVVQARNSPFGQYLLSQTTGKDADLDKLSALVGFDPRRDITELLMASSGDQKRGLVLARGAFDPGKIGALAQQKGATTLDYAGSTILIDPKKTGGVTFADPTLAILGDIESIKAALDRWSAPTTLPAQVLSEVAQWSLQDAWMVAVGLPGSFKLPQGAPPQMAQQPSIQSIKGFDGGLKFGSSVVVTARAVADTNQNATALAGAIQLITNLMQMQSAQNPQAATLLKSLVVTTTGNAVDLSWSIPQDQLEQILKQHRAAGSTALAPKGSPKGPRRTERKI